MPGWHDQTLDISPQLLRHFKINPMLGEVCFALGRVKIEAHLWYKNAPSKI
jgi:hypothetical protein